MLIEQHSKNKFLFINAVAWNTIFKELTTAPLRANVIDTGNTEDASIPLQ
jgi:hypothetical protein